jgi:ribosomal protein S18 acetylase RimI-like enzyme
MREAPPLAFRLRPAAAADAEGVARVYVASWRATYRGLVPAATLGRLTETSEIPYWRRALQRPGQRAVVATAAGEGVVGFLTAGPDRSGGDHRFTAEIYTLYLLPALVRRGLGRRLMAAAAEQLMADGYKAARVWALRDNPSREFYRALGGAPAGRKTVLVDNAPLAVVCYEWLSLEALEERAAGLSALPLPDVLRRRLPRRPGPP